MNWKFWKKKEEISKESTKKLVHRPYILDAQRTFVRGIDTIKFRLAFEKKNKNYDKPRLFSVTFKENRYKAYVKIEYDFKTNDHTSHMDDGYINKDNGFVTHKIDDNCLLNLEWHLGTGITLGRYDVEMTLVCEGQTVTDKETVTIHEQSLNYEKSSLGIIKPRTSSG